jgi:hypothetical protein
LGPNILLSTLFVKTLSIPSSFSVSDHVSHPLLTTSKIIVLYLETKTVIIIIIIITNPIILPFSYFV